MLCYNSLGTVRSMTIDCDSRKVRVKLVLAKWEKRYSFYKSTDALGDTGYMWPNRQWQYDNRLDTQKVGAMQQTKPRYAFWSQRNGIGLLTHYAQRNAHQYSTHVDVYHLPGIENHHPSNTLPP